MVRIYSKEIFLKPYCCKWHFYSRNIRNILFVLAGSKHNEQAQYITHLFHYAKITDDRKNPDKSILKSYCMRFMENYTLTLREIHISPVNEYLLVILFLSLHIDKHL